MCCWLAARHPAACRAGGVSFDRARVFVVVGIWPDLSRVVNDIAWRLRGRLWFDRERAGAAPRHRKRGFSRICTHPAAEAYGKRGLTAEGLNYLTEAEQIVETADDRHHAAELYRVRGDLLNATGDQIAAEGSYHQALSVARRQSARTLELHAATSLARLWRDQGKRGEARDLLAPVYNWFTEGFDTPVLQDAKALLDDLADAPA